jgi:uncharacterized Zn finger protein
MCKHLAAVMYGVGNRLDSSPELLFLLRAVDHAELIEQAIPAATPKARRGAPAIAAGDLGSIFGIEIDDAPAPEPKAKARKTPAKKAAKATPIPEKPATKTVAKKAAATKTTITAKKAVATKTTITAKKAVATKTTITAKKTKKSSPARKNG